MALGARPVNHADVDEWHPLTRCWSHCHPDERRDRDHVIMKRTDKDSARAAPACDVCGQLPHPRKVRLTLANVAVMLPVELLVHAAVVNTDMPYFQKVLVLTLIATFLVIWVNSSFRLQA